jgi:hypothetical protein
MSKKSIALLVTAVLLTSCWLFDSGSDRIAGKYKVLWIDLPETQHISEEFEMHSSGSEEEVPPYVFAVGHNDDFIIAKQHPTSGFETHFKIDTTITHYYIIDLHGKGRESNQETIGPLTKTAFDAMRKQLGIESISFDMNYPEVP